MNVNGKTRLFGVIGRPVGHSLSPLIHNYLFRQMGVDAVYLPLPLGRTALPLFLRVARLTSFDGFNVTTPHKVSVIRCCRSLENTAACLRSVNTLVRKSRGWKGCSTDGEGLCRFIETELAFSLNEKKVLLLGAGPAARACIHSILKRPVASLTVVNRSPGVFDSPFFRRVAGNQATARVVCGDPVVLDAVGEADLVVNATSWGLGGGAAGAAPWKLDSLRDDALVVDLNYGGGHGTPFLRLLEEKTGTYDGTGMLRWQALLSFEAWTGRKVDISLQRRLKDLLACLDNGKKRNL